jgi:hypothetical protein
VNEKMKEQTKIQEESGRDRKDVIKSYRNQLSHMEKELVFRERDLDLKKRILDFEKGHCNVVDGKPGWLTCPEYMDLIIEQKELQHEVNLVQMKDQIAKLSDGIKSIKKEITRLERNGGVKKDE